MTEIAAPSRFGPLWRHSDFMRLWAAQTFSAFGSRITRTALPMIAILTIDASPTQIAILGTLGFAPGLIVGLVAGGAVDRRMKRPLMIGADLVRAAIILTIPLAAWTGLLSMPQLYLTAALVGAASALFDIADRSYLPVLVAPEHLVDANAKLQATDSIAEAAGPGAAGVLIQLFTAPVAVILDALTYLWSAFMLGRVRAGEPAAPAEQERADLFADVAIGFRAVLSEPLVRPAFLADALTALFNGFFMTLYMIVMLRLAHMSPGMAGIVIGLGGVGAFAGALIAAPLQRALGAGPAIIVSFTLAALAMLFVPLAAAAPALALAFFVAQQLLGDSFSAVYQIHAMSLRQRTMAAHVLGRANAAFQVAAGLMLPIGALISGPLAERIGVAETAWIGAIGMLLAAPFLFFSALARTR